MTWTVEVFRKRPGLGETRIRVIGTYEDEGAAGRVVVAWGALYSEKPGKYSVRRRFRGAPQTPEDAPGSPRGGAA